MEAKSLRAELIDRYLLGELSEEERGRLEGEFFADPDLLDEVEASRDELIDAYLRGELSRRESERFERYFLATPRRRERVEFARSLLQTAAARPSPDVAGVARRAVSWWRSLPGPLVAHRRLALTAASVLLLAAGSWLAFRLLSSQNQGGARPGDEVASARPAQSPTPIQTPLPGSATGSDVTAAPTAAPSATPTPEKEPSEPRREPQVAAFVLTPSLVRDEGESERLVVPRRAEVVLLRFGFEGEARQNYRAWLRTPEGRTVLDTRRVGLRKTTDGWMATLRLPARLLRDGDYILRLMGTTGEGETVDVARFYFRIERK